MRALVYRPALKISFSVVVLVCCCALPAWGAQEDPVRASAFQLFKDGNYAEALPVFEKLAAKYPEDRDVIKTFGYLVISQTAYIKDATDRKEARRRGRELLVRAQDLGATDALVRSMLEEIPPDGGEDEKLSVKKEAEDAMREGEAALVKKDFPKAIEMYQLALLFDPKLYEAALFTGDVYYVSAEQKKAGEWFARAVAIDPDRETAYRYWGDSLMKQGRPTEAGDKFIEAYLAEPYSRLARVAFLDWGKRVNLNLNHPEVDIPTDVTSNDAGDVTINLSALRKNNKSGAGVSWLTYSLVRASWQKTDFAKQYPNEKKYRHSLKEEATALRAALKTYDGQKKTNPKATDASLQLLAKLDQEGFLESFILLGLPDEGIVQDYLEYRRTNLEALRRYVKQYVLTGGNGQ